MLSKAARGRALERMPPVYHPLAAHLRRWWSRADYRKQQCEIGRLRRMPRFMPGQSDLPGVSVEFPDAASFLFMWEEIFEREIYKFSSSNNAPRILDGGANIGLSTLYFKRLFPQSRITAFEPDPQIAAMLERNFERAGLRDVEIERAALWSREETLHFQAEGADGGRVARPADAPTQEVRAVRLRPYLDEPVELLKLDIEGAELEVLADCAPALSNVQRLFVEYHGFEGEPQRLGELLGLLEKSGFRLHVGPSLSSPQPFESRLVISGMELQLNVWAFR